MRKGVSLVKIEWCPCGGLEARSHLEGQSGSTKTDNQPNFICMSQVEQAEMRQHYATLCDSGTSLDKDDRLL